MNSQFKTYSIILYLIWPFSAIFIGLRNFNSVFGKRLLIALYAFLGYTAFSTGDLERYEIEFYENKTADISEVFQRLTSIQTSKFYNYFVSTVSGNFIESHHYYFLILFFIYGFFYMNTIHLLKEGSIKRFSNFGLLFFFGVLLFFLIRPIPNIAFYTGGVFIFFNSISYYKTDNKKFLIWIILAPLFHLGLTIYLILPLFLVIFKNNNWCYIALVFLTFAIGKSSVVGAIESISESNTDTIIESKYKVYVDEEGRASLDERYLLKELSSNIKLKSLNFLQNAVMYFFVPLGIVILYFKRKQLLLKQEVMKLFQISLIFWSISNLMLNISQGERFLNMFSFIGIALFFVVYTKTNLIVMQTIFSKFLYVFVPILFLLGLMAAYASNPMLSIRFFVSNFFIEIIRCSF